MALDRTTIYNALSSPAGTDFLDQYSDYLNALLDVSVMRLVSVAGTNTITASVEPIGLPAAGLTSGMKFTFVPAANNTGAVTLNIDSSGAVSVVNADGGALDADDLDSSTRYLIEYDGTNFVVLTSVAATPLGSLKTTYDTTSVWTNSFSATALIRVQLWGGGGGGGESSGGGGGAYAEDFYIAGDLPASVTITVGAGGSIGGEGGNSSFGSFLTAYGGGGASLSIARSGGGGGEIEAGSEGAAGAIGGGAPNGHATTIYGGAGGGSGNGGHAVWGGGGGGATDVAANNGGTSVYGGDGGDGGSSSTAGTLPGGGGGGGNSNLSQAKAGGGGRCIVTVIRT